MNSDPNCYSYIAVQSFTGIAQSHLPGTERQSDIKHTIPDISGIEKTVDSKNRWQSTRRLYE